MPRPCGREDGCEDARPVAVSIADRVAARKPNLGRERCEPCGCLIQRPLKAIGAIDAAASHPRARQLWVRYNLASADAREAAAERRDEALVQLQEEDEAACAEARMGLAHVAARGEWERGFLPTL
eukprot:5695117-Prymnesium_polylepis.1